MENCVHVTAHTTSLGKKSKGKPKRRKNNIQHKASVLVQKVKVSEKASVHKLSTGAKKENDGRGRNRRG